MIFCDWFSGFINLDLDYLHDGRVIKIKGNGEIEFETLCLMQVTGSYDDTISVKSCLIPAAPEWSAFRGQNISANYRVYISGNPTKFLQGHNVYGHSDMLGVIMDFIKLVLQKLDIDEFTIARVLKDPIRITRLDITQNYVLDSALAVSDWLRHAAVFMTGKNQKVDNDKTVYIGKNSRRVSIKIYNKANEMLFHRKTFNLDDSAFLSLHNTALNLIRIEVTLRGKKLDDLTANYIQKVSNPMLNELYESQLHKMNLPENIEVTEEIINELSPKFAGVYRHWQNGIDLKTRMSKAQYYRYRKFFLDNYNLDISLPPRDLPKKSNVIPLWRYIVAGDRIHEPAADDLYLYVPTSSRH